MGLHFVLCCTKKVGQSCSETRFNRLMFVRMGTKLGDTGLMGDMHLLYTFSSLAHASIKSASEFSDNNQSITNALIGLE